MLKNAVIYDKLQSLSHRVQEFHIHKCLDNLMNFIFNLVKYLLLIYGMAVLLLCCADFVLQIVLSTK